MVYNVKSKEHIFEGKKFFPQCHASTLVALDNGDILSAWFAGSYEGHSDVAIWLSKRGQRGWSDPIKVADVEEMPCWNPVLFNDNKGTIFLFYKVGKTIPSWFTMFKTSTDDGDTWSEPKELIKGDTGGRGPVRNKPIILSDNTFLAPASTETETDWDAFVDISKDGGKTWTKSGMVPRDADQFEGKGLIQPTLWESKPGMVHMLIRSTEGFIYRSDSEDNGLSWSKAYPTDLPNNNSGIDLIKLENGALVLVYNPIKGNWAARTPIVCSISYDNGNSWEDELVLEHNEKPKDKTDGEFSYPAIVSRGNMVYITYTWKRRSVIFYEIEITIN